ncbi:MAG TPA: DMT family transporter [Burkholderiales bacterium]|nr:DMT family transporter [Burkholderiales bacterium]
MELSAGVTVAVLGAALLHASWNALVKSGRDPLLDMALLTFAGSAIATALALALRLAPPVAASWPYLAASTVIHVGYYVALAGAYRAGDLSHGYPIMRGTAPLLTAVGTWLLLGEPLSPAAAAGVLLISGGVLSLGFAGGGASGRATAWALTSAALIALYTLADGAGVRVSGDAFRYVVWVFVVHAVPFWLGMLVLKRGELLRHAARHWKRGFGGAALSGLSYGIALWAMTRAPVAIVAALRETAVIFGALIGAWLLREGHLRARLAGAAVVLAGLVALRL